MNISIIDAEKDNLDLLFRMNKELMEDEQYDRRPSDGHGLRRTLLSILLNLI